MVKFMKISSDAPGTQFKPVFLKQDGTTFYRLVGGIWKKDSTSVKYLTGDHVVETLKSDPSH